MKVKQIWERWQGVFQRDRALAHMVTFFLLMLLLTLIARGTSGAIMARVELTESVPYTFLQDDGEQMEYGTCVPLSALHKDADGYFVYVYTTRTTIWGMENIAVRVDVGVGAMDWRYVALFAELEKDAQIITGSNKPLSDGDRVRVAS